MTFDYFILGETIRDIRKAKGLSQEVLSGLAGLARTHLSMIENGTMKANIDTIYKITQALNIQASDLFAIVEQKQQIKK